MFNLFSDVVLVDLSPRSNVTRCTTIGEPKSWTKVVKSRKSDDQSIIEIW